MLEQTRQAPTVVLIKNDGSPVMFPLLNPYGHVVFQAQRGDVHTVLVNGRLVKFDHRLVGIDLGEYRNHMRRRSGKWETVSLPAADFRQLARPIESWL